MTHEETDGRDDLTRRLDELAAEERATMDESARFHDAPGVDDVERVLRGAMGEASPALSSRESRRPLFALAAIVTAVGLVGLWWALQRGAEPGPGPEMLGRLQLELLEPQPKTRVFDRIEWTFPSPSGRTFRVTVLTDDRRVLLDEPGLRETVFPLDSERTSTWPDSIVIEIVARDESGALLDSLRASVSRSH